MRNSETPVKNRNIPVLLAVVIVVGAAVLALLLPASPPVMRENAPVDEFSAERAVKHLQEIARHPHPIGSTAHDRVRDYIVASLRQLGLEVQTQKTTVIPSDSPQAAHVENILARLPGANPQEPAVLLVTHYDSATVSLGAADDGAGVAAFLETLRALNNSPQLPSDLIILIDDGEEKGLLGAYAFVEQHPWAKQVGVVLNFEARGTTGASLMFETSPGNSNLIGQFIAAAPHPAATSLAYEIYRLMPNGTDFTVFKKAGYNGLNFAFIEAPWNYHTPGDAVANLDLRSLQHHGEYALSLVRHFASHKVAKKTTNAVYFNPLGSWIVSYSERWLIPLHAALILGAIALFTLGIRQSRLSLSRIGISFSFLLLAGVVSVGAALTFHFLLQKAHLILAIGTPLSFRLSGGYLLALVGIVLLILSALFPIVRGRMGWANLTAAAIILWMVLAVVTTIYVPGASYLFTWPTLFGLGALGFLMGRPTLHNLSFAGGLVLTVALLPVAVIFPPILYLLLIALGLESFIAAAIGLVICLLFAISLPLFEALEALRPKSSMVMAGVIVLSGLAFGVNTAHNTFPATRFSNMQYVFDTDSNKAWWYCQISQRNGWTDAFMPKPETGHPYLKGAGVATAFLRQSAPVTALAAPRLEVIGDHTEGLKRTLVLKVLCDDNPTVIHMANEDFPAETIKVDGRLMSVGDRSDRKGFAFFLTNPQAEGFVVEIVVESKASPLNLTLMAYYPGLPRLDGFAPPPRPADISPIDDGDVSRVRKTFKL